MSDDKDGGPAFPTLPDTPPQWDGMSLRDYFAAAALPVIISECTAPTIGTSAAAALAYSMADAMLAERAKTGGQ